jgi:starvation-inducible DNA-binding protein
MKLHEKMNAYLANQQVMFIKLHNLHWYIKGSAFFTLHPKLEELYNTTALIIDEVAERMLMIGASPVASLQGALELTKVKELEDRAIGSNEAVSTLAKDVEWWIADSKEIITLAESEGDTGTAELFGGYLGQYQKLQWMLSAYLDQ